MKVRAKVKAPDQWPDIYRCCDAAIARRQTWGEFVVETDRMVYEPAWCADCDIYFGKRHGLRAINGVDYPVELLDLDEGPMEAQ